MTLLTTHRIRNSSPGDVRSKTPPVGYGDSPQYWIFTRERGRNTFLFEIWMPERWTNPRFRLSKQAALNTAPGSPSNMHGNGWLRLGVNERYRKYETSRLCWFNADPASATLAQHWNTTASTSRGPWGFLSVVCLLRLIAGVLIQLNSQNENCRRRCQAGLGLLVYTALHGPNFHTRYDIS